MSQDNLKQQIKKGVYWKFLESFVNQSMQFVVGIVMARLLTPSDYGITALPVIFMAIANVFIDGGFGLALIRKPELTEKDMATAFYYSSISGIICYFILFLTAPIIASFYDTPILTKMIRIIALVFIVGALTTPQTILLNRKLDFKTLARISVLNKIIASGVGIYAAYHGYGLWALVISGLVSSIIGLIQTWLVVRWMPKEKFSTDSFKYLWNFGNKMIMARLIDITYSNLTPAIVGKYFSPFTLGLYNRAMTFAQLPSMQINGIIQSVTFPVLSKMKDDNESLSKKYRRMITATAFVVFPLMFLLIALAKPIILILLTDKWEGCIILIQILCLYLMWGPISVTNISILNVKGRTDLILKLEYKKKIAGIVITVLTLPLGLIVFCCGNILNQMFCIYVNFRCVEKVIGLSFMKQIKDVLPIFILSSLTYTIVFCITQLFTNQWVQIITGSVVGLCFYISVTYILKLEVINDMKYMLNRKK